MTLISPDDVEEFWEKMVMDKYETLKENYSQLTEFVEYILDNYFEGSFILSLWNHFLTVGNRTNNHLEGYNKKLKLFLVPNHFQIEEVNAALHYFRADNPDKSINQTNP